VSVADSTLERDAPNDPTDLLATGNPTPVTLTATHHAEYPAP
jgi:hypothetical protein